MAFKKLFKENQFYFTSIIVWVIFIAYEILFSYLLAGQLSNLFDYLAAYSINIIFFYVNAYIVLPFIFRKSIFTALTVLILEFSCYTVLKYIISFLANQVGISEVDVFTEPVSSLIQSIWRYIYFMGLSTGYWFSINVIRQRKEIYDLEKNRLNDQLNAERLEKKLITSNLAYLKSQINPHFLFNTLNFLYNTANKSAPSVSEPILLLSDIMRYALTETNSTGKVSILEEIEQIKTFITLNQYRFEHELQISFETYGDFDEINILPLILLTPVENLFKYADLKNKAFPAKITLHVSSEALTFKVNNKKSLSRKHYASRGIGLNNLKLRLEAYYTNRHSLIILDEENFYTLTLKILL
jgi:two-component system LytT family sensor kinase